MISDVSFNSKQNNDPPMQKIFHFNLVQPKKEDLMLVAFAMPTLAQRHKWKCLPSFAVRQE